jgi:SAM-dependent methyltransferase
VLEVGCGFGRHLEYLRRIPGLDVAGCDQSRSMVDAMREWAAPGWIDEHVRIVAPLDPLPYPDGAFDVVFTVSVLIHVRPEHVEPFLRELLRVSRGQILHIENPPVAASFQTAVVHDGCWAHPLVDLYARLGCRAEVLPKPFELEDVYRVVVAPDSRVHDPSPVVAERLLALDRDVVGHIETLGATIADLEAKMKRLWADNAQLRTAHAAGERCVAAALADVERAMQRCAALERELGRLRADVARRAAFRRELTRLVDAPAP